MFTNLGNLYLILLNILIFYLKTNNILIRYLNYLILLILFLYLSNNFLLN